MTIEIDCDECGGSGEITDICGCCEYACPECGDLQTARDEGAERGWEFRRRELAVAEAVACPAEPDRAIWGQALFLPSAKRIRRVWTSSPSPAEIRTYPDNRLIAAHEAGGAFAPPVELPAGTTVFVVAWGSRLHPPVCALVEAKGLAP